MAALGPEKTAEKPSGNTGLWIGLGCLVVVNLVVGVMFAPRHVELHHPPVVQLPNFLTSVGVPGEWMPAHVTFMWLIMALLVGSGALVTRSLRPVPGALQNLMEVVIEAFYGLLDQMIGKQGRQFLPLIGTAGLFI